MSLKWQLKIGDVIFISCEDNGLILTDTWILAVVSNISKYPRKPFIMNKPNGMSDQIFDIYLEESGEEWKKYIINAGALDDMLISEGVKNMLPGKRELTEARDVYLGYSSKNEIEMFGMQAIGLKILMKR